LENRRVVDQRIDAVPVTRDRVEHRLDLVRTGEVATVGVNMVPASRGFFQRFDSPAADEHGIALLGELPRQSAADAGAAPREQNRLLHQFHRLIAFLACSPRHAIVGARFAPS